MKDAAQERKEQIAQERSGRIKKDYLGYLKIANERDADGKLSRIFKSTGDVDKVISAAVKQILHVYPVPITAATFKGDIATPQNPGALMASNARNLAHGSSMHCYFSHRRELMRASNGTVGGNAETVESNATWNDPSSYIATIARQCSIRELKGENKYQAWVRRTFTTIVSESSKPGESRFIIKTMLNLFGMETGRESVGLVAWKRQEDRTKDFRVRELLERPDEVRTRENFKVWRITSREDLEELMAETLTYCGTTISKVDFWRYVKHCCEVDVMSLDDAGEQADSEMDVERQVIGDVRAHDLFDKLTDLQRQVLMLRHEKTESNEDMPFDQIAKILGITRDAADGRYRDAIKKLRKEASAKGLRAPVQEQTDSQSGKSGR